MHEPYDWQTIRAILQEALAQTETFALFARIGSTDLTHDIDMVSVKKTDSPSAQFLREIHGVLDALNHTLQTRYGQKLVRFSRFSHEDAVKHVAGFTQGDFPLHLMNYRSLPELAQNWNADMVLGEDPRQILTQNTDLEVLAGSVDQALKNEKQLSHGALFQYIERRDRVHSHFPKDLLIESSNELFYYLEKRLGLDEQFRAQDESDVREGMYYFAEQIEQQEN